MTFGIHDFGDIDTENSTTSVLGASGVFTGQSKDVAHYSLITVNVYSDQASAEGGLKLQQSSDGVNWDRTKTADAPVGASAHTLAIVARYFRVVYTNGAIGQSVFRLQTRYHITQSGNPIEGLDDDNNQVAVSVTAAGAVKVETQSTAAVETAQLSQAKMAQDVAEIKGMLREIIQQMRWITNNDFDDFGEAL